jgi:phage baseplate assembly protein gpV
MGRDMTGGRAITGAVALAAVALAGCASPSLDASSHSAASAASSALSLKSKSVFSGHSGSAHTISTPTQLDSYTRSPSLEKAMNVNGLGEQVVKGSSGQASDVLSAVYAQGNVMPGAGGNQQIFMFVGGHLASSDPAASIARFEQTYPSAQVVPAGSLGGEAACATTAASNESAAMCVWFDNDSFGTLVSPTMSSAKLANTLDAVRPGIEQAGQ